jgi:hypothetical protein
MSNIDMILLSVMAILMLLCIVVSIMIVKEKKEEEKEVPIQVKGKTQFISPVDVQEVYKESEEVGDFINKLE